MRLIQNSKEKVIGAALKKDPSANPAVLRNLWTTPSTAFRFNSAKKNIQALANAAKLGVNMDAPGVLDKFFNDDFLAKV